MLSRVLLPQPEGPMMATSSPGAIARLMLLTAVSAGAWWAIVPAGVAVALVIMGCYLFGQSIEDALNPRLKVAHLSPRSWRLRTLVGRGPDAL